MAEPNALHGLYGGRAAREARDNTIKSMIGTGARPQEVYTPEALCVAIRAFYGGEVDLDPCSGPESKVGATEAWQGKPIDTNKRKQDGTPVYAWAGPGLDNPWHGRVYMNSPYDTLQRWMGKLSDERAAGRCEVLQLGPVRTHRRWWRSTARTAAHACWLDGNFKFEGYEQNAPFPLVLFYYGDRSRLDFRKAFDSFGDVSAVRF